MKSSTKTVLWESAKGLCYVLFWLVLMITCEYHRTINLVPMTSEAIVMFTIMGFMAVVTGWLCLWSVGFIVWCEKNSGIMMIPLTFGPLLCLTFMINWYGSQLPSHVEVACLAGSHYPSNEQYAYMQTPDYQKYGGCIR